MNTDHLLQVTDDAPPEEAMRVLREEGASAYRVYIRRAVKLASRELALELAHHVAGQEYRYRHGWKKIDAPAPPEPDLLGAIKEHGGFTYDPRLHKLLGVGDGSTKGFAVAVPHTEKLLGGKDMTREQFQEAILGLVREHPEQFDRGGANIGGWFSDDRGQYMVEVSELHDVPRTEAVKLGQWRNQEAILDMATGEFIDTGGTGG